MTARAVSMPSLDEALASWLYFDHFGHQQNYARWIGLTPVAQRPWLARAARLRAYAIEVGFPLPELKARRPSADLPLLMAAE